MIFNIRKKKKMKTHEQFMIIGREEKVRANNHFRTPKLITVQPFKEKSTVACCSTREEKEIPWLCAVVIDANANEIVDTKTRTRLIGCLST